MAGGNVKGISVEIGGNTTKLTKALDSVKYETNSIQKEMCIRDSHYKQYRNRHDKGSGAGYSKR